MGYYYLIYQYISRKKRKLKSAKLIQQILIFIISKLIHIKIEHKNKFKFFKISLNICFIRKVKLSILTSFSNKDKVTSLVGKIGPVVHSWNFQRLKKQMEIIWTNQDLQMTENHRHGRLLLSHYGGECAGLCWLGIQQK